MSDKVQNQPPKKSKAALVFIGFMVVFFILVSRHEAVNTIECTPEIIKKKPDVIMLGAWWCSYCYQAKRYFQNNSINYCEYDMENTEKGKQLYEENGGGAVPLILIGNYRLQGFNPEMIEAALAETKKQSH